MVRLWETLLTIVEAEAPLTIGEINERVAAVGELREFKGKIATTRTDLWTLIHCGFPIRLETEDGEEIDLDEYQEMEQKRGRLKNVRWCLRPASEIGVLQSPMHRRPTPAQLTALTLLRALLKDFVPRRYPLYAQVQQLSEHLLLWYNHHLRASEIMPTRDPLTEVGKVFLRSERESDRLLLVEEAIRRRCCIDGRYLKPGANEVTEVHVAPQAIWFSEGKCMILASAPTDTRLYNFRLDRFEHLSIDPTPAGVDIPANDIDDALKSSFRGFLAPPQRVILRVDPVISYLFDEYRFHPSQQVERMPDGGLIVTFECAVSLALEEWILGLGENAEVLEPSTLRNSISNRVQRIYARYHGGKPLPEGELIPTSI